MNLTIRGIEANLGKKHADSFHNDLHKSLKADYILANPPFNDSDWGADKLKEDVRWKKYNIVPPNNNANYAWILHFIYHLSPNGVAGFVMANGSLSSQTSGEEEIRKAIVEDDLVDCIVSLPSNLFLTTQIPACLWFITRNKNDKKHRDRRGETLFIDARTFGHMIDRKTREFSQEDIEKISSIYHKWKSKENNYKDIKGLCKSVTIDEIIKNNYILTPGRYIELDENTVDEYESSKRFLELKTELEKLLVESNKLNKKISVVLRYIEDELLE